MVDHIISTQKAHTTRSNSHQCSNCKENMKLADDYLGSCLGQCFVGVFIW